MAADDMKESTVPPEHWLFLSDLVVDWLVWFYTSSGEDMSYLFSLVFNLTAAIRGVLPK